MHMQFYKKADVDDYCIGYNFNNDYKQSILLDILNIYFFKKPNSSNNHLDIQLEYQILHMHLRLDYIHINTQCIKYDQHLCILSKYNNNKILLVVYQYQYYRNYDNRDIKNKNLLNYLQYISYKSNGIFNMNYW